MTDVGRLRSFATEDLTELDLSRPWSGDEVALLMQRVVVAIEAETASLKVLAEKAAEAKYEVERLEARWMLTAKVERPDLTSNEMRRSWFLGDDDTGVGQARFEATRAESAYKDQAMVLRNLQHQGDLLRSLLSRHKAMEEQWQ